MPFSRFITATHARINYNPDHVCYYQIEDNGKLKLHFSNGDSKELESDDARAFLAECERISIPPSQAA